MRIHSICVAVAACVALTGCPTDDEVTETDDTDVEMVPASVEVTSQLPTAVDEDTEFTVTWTISGTGVTVIHTNLHCCPASEPDCAPASEGGPRLDSPVSGVDAGGDGSPGDYSGALAIPEPGEYACSVHSKLQEPDLPEPSNYHESFDLTVNAVSQ